MLLLGAVSFGTSILSIVTVTFGWRYLVPMQPMMAGAGVMGAAALVQGLRPRLAALRERRAVPVS